MNTLNDVNNMEYDTYIKFETLMKIGQKALVSINFGGSFKEIFVYRVSKEMWSYNRQFMYL